LKTLHTGSRNVSSCFSTTPARQLQTCFFNHKATLIICLVFLILFLTTATCDVTFRTLILHVQLHSYPASYKIFDRVTQKVTLISSAHTHLYTCILYTCICHSHAHTRIYATYIYISMQYIFTDLYLIMYFFYVHVTVHRNKLLYNKTNQMH
jgi:hypothetical protein